MLSRRVTGVLLVLLLAVSEYHAVAARIDRGRAQTHRLSHLLKSTRRAGGHVGVLSASSSASEVVMAASLGAALRPDETRRLTLMREVIAKVLEPAMTGESTVELFDELITLATGVPLSTLAIDPLQTELIGLADRAVAQAKTALSASKEAAAALTFADTLLGSLKKAVAAKTWSEALDTEVKGVIEKTLKEVDPKGATESAEYHADVLPVEHVSTFDLNAHYGITIPSGAPLVSAKALLEMAAAKLESSGDSGDAAADALFRFRSGATVRNPCTHPYLIGSALALILAFVLTHYPEMTVPLVVTLVVLVLFGACWLYQLSQRNRPHGHAHAANDGVNANPKSGASGSGQNNNSGGGRRQPASKNPPKRRAEFPPHTDGVFYYPVEVVIPFHGAPAETLNVAQDPNTGCVVRLSTAVAGTAVNDALIAELTRCQALATELELQLPLTLDQNWIASVQFHTSAPVAWGGNVVVPAPQHPLQFGVFHPGGNFMLDEMLQRTGLKPLVVTLNPLTRVRARLQRRTGPAVAYHGNYVHCYTGLAATTLNNARITACGINTLNAALNNLYTFTVDDLMAPHAANANLQGYVTIVVKEPYPIVVASYDATGVRVLTTTYVRHNACTGLNQACLDAIGLAPNFAAIGVVLRANGYSPMAYKHPHNHATFNAPVVWGGAAIPADVLASANPTLTIEVLRTMPGAALPPTASHVHFPGTLSTGNIGHRAHQALGFNSVDNLRVNTAVPPAGASEHVFYLNCVSGRFATNAAGARDAAVTAMQVASGQALGAMTPDGLFASINDAGMNRAGVGAPPVGPDRSRALKTALEIAHGPADTHFGYFYADITVQIMGLIPAVTALRAQKQVGWLCAADNRPHGPVNLHSAVGAGVHTEQRCLEQLRRFVMLLEGEDNANRVARKVTHIRTRWFTDYTPDDADEQHCAWAIAFTRYASERGQWRTAAGEYDETVRGMAKTQTQCNARLGAQNADGAITWANPVGHCTYRNYPANSQMNARAAAHAAAVLAGTPGNVPTYVQETANTPAPAGSAGPYTTMIWPIAP